MKLTNQLFATLDQEQPVQPGFNGDGPGGCSRPVSFPFANGTSGVIQN